jgi:hypothetical protein
MCQKKIATSVQITFQCKTRTKPFENARKEALQNRTTFPV